MGTGSLMDFKDSPLLMGLFWYNGTSGGTCDRDLVRQPHPWLHSRHTALPYLAGQSNVVWAAVHNQFFALAAVPRASPAGRRPPRRSPMESSRHPREQRPGQIRLLVGLEPPSATRRS